MRLNKPLKALVLLVPFAVEVCANEMEARENSHS